MISINKLGAVGETAYANTFMRHEIKYLLSEEQTERILERVSPFMSEDVFSGQTVASVYCDSLDDQLIRASLDKPVYKEKLRLRAYGVPDGDSRVFLEIKKKFRGTVFKRRAEMSCREALEYLNGGALPELSGYYDRQVMEEISALSRRIGAVPRTALFYDRRAFCGDDDRELRLTLDGNIRYRTDDLDPRLGNSGITLAGQPFRIMEIKAAGAVPLWLVGILSELEIYPGSFSKYGAVYRQLCGAGAARTGVT